MNPRRLIFPEPGWLDSPTPGRVAGTGLTAFLGLAIYGFTVGYWRDPRLGCYVALKMPLLVALTLGCNGLLNGLFGMLLGTGLGFRQSFVALMTSFAQAALILGSLAPVTFFLALNAPGPPNSPRHPPPTPTCHERPSTIIRNPSTASRSTLAGQTRFEIPVRGTAA